MDAIDLACAPPHHVEVVHSEAEGEIGSTGVDPAFGCGHSAARSELPNGAQLAAGHSFVDNPIAGVEPQGVRDEQGASARLGRLDHRVGILEGARKRLLAQHGCA